MKNTINFLVGFLLLALTSCNSVHVNNDKLPVEVTNTPLAVTLSKPIDVNCTGQKITPFNLFVTSSNYGISMKTINDGLNNHEALVINYSYCTTGNVSIRLRQTKTDIEINATFKNDTPINVTLVRDNTVNFGAVNFFL